MALKFTDPWEKLQGALLEAGAEPNQRRQALDALEIKKALESIEQQETMVSLQRRVEHQAKSLTNATWVLVIVTFLFFCSTVWSVWMNNKGSEKQINALNDLTSASNKQAESILQLQKSINAVQGAIRTSTIMRDKEFNKRYPLNR